MSVELWSLDLLVEAYKQRQRRTRGLRERPRSGRREAAPRDNESTGVGLLPPPIEPCVRFSLTRLTRRLSPPAFGFARHGRVRSWHDDASVEVDQAHLVR